MRLSETEKPESKDEKPVATPEVKEEPESKEESVPKDDSEDVLEVQSEKVDDKEEHVSPKDLGEHRDDGDAATDSQPAGDEDVQPPKTSSVHFDEDAKAPVDVDESKEKDVEKSVGEEGKAPETQSEQIEAQEPEIKEPESKEIESKEPESKESESKDDDLSKEHDIVAPVKEEEQSPETQSEHIESKEPESKEPKSENAGETTVDADSQDKSKPEVADAHDDKPEQISKENEDSLPRDTPSKDEEPKQAADDEEVSSPKADTDGAVATGIPFSDEEPKSEAKDEKGTSSYIAVAQKCPRYSFSAVMGDQLEMDVDKLLVNLSFDMATISSMSVPNLTLHTFLS